MWTLQFLTITNQVKYNILQIHSVRQIFELYTKLMLPFWVFLEGVEKYILSIFLEDKEHVDVMLVLHLHEK